MRGYLMVHRFWNYVDPSMNLHARGEKLILIRGTILEKVGGTLFQKIQYLECPREMCNFIHKEVQTIRDS